VVKRLWDSWQDDTIIADKASGIFAHGTRVHRIDHAGDYFTVRGPLTALRPRQGRPVIVQWDMSAEGLALAATTADVFLASCHSLEEALAFSARLRAATAAAGRDPAALRILLNVMPILAATASAAQDRAAMLDAAVTPALAEALLAEAGAVDLAAVLTSRSGLRFIGTAATLAEQMAAWVVAGACDGWNLRPAVLPDDLDLLLGEVAPALQRAGQLRQGYAGATLREHLGLARPVNPNVA
jgi:alkanesulfonate monooxygenase SsuD/methylene tetrahydromethanopterin reductase-like flavin-dependent oxidoreductase (luciferase family)